jgi:hypothetical protein
MAKANSVPTALCTAITGAKGNPSTNSIRSANAQVRVPIVGRRLYARIYRIVSASSDDLRFALIISGRTS